MTERERLIKELKNDLIGIDSPLWIENVASFILADRRRICGPLIKLNKIPQDDIVTYGARMEDAIDETLRLAGLDKE